MARQHHADTERTRRAVDETTPSDTTPRKGETYRCERCGMELKVSADCACDDPEMVHLECCGQELSRV